MYIKSVFYKVLVLSTCVMMPAEQQGYFGASVTRMVYYIVAYVWQTPCTLVKAYAHDIDALINDPVHKKGIVQSSYPLHYACEHDLVDVVDFFINKNVDINACDQGMITCAVSQKKSLSYEAKVLFACTPLQRACQAGASKVVRRLLCCPLVQPNMQNPYGFAALHVAAFCNQPQIVRLLCHYGVNKALCNDYGRDALCVACTQQSSLAVKELLDAGCSPNTQDRWGSIPLCWADYDSACLLLLYGADVNSRNYYQTALLGASHNKNNLLIRLFFSYGADLKNPALASLVPQQDDVLIQALVRYGSAPIVQNGFVGYTASAQPFDFLRRALSFDKDTLIAQQRDHFFWKLLAVVQLSDEINACLWAHAFNKGNYAVAAELLYRFPAIVDQCAKIQNVLPTHVHQQACRILCKAHLYPKLTSIEKWKDCVLQFDN